jgi:hypothetical protein
MSEPIRRRRSRFGLLVAAGLACLPAGCWRLNLQPTTGSDHRLFSVDDPLPKHAVKTAEMDPAPPEVVFEEPLPAPKPRAKQKFLPED